MRGCQGQGKGDIPSSQPNLWSRHAFVYTRNIRESVQKMIPAITTARLSIYSHGSEKSGLYVSPGGTGTAPFWASAMWTDNRIRSGQTVMTDSGGGAPGSYENDGQNNCHAQVSGEQNRSSWIDRWDASEGRLHPSRAARLSISRKTTNRTSREGMRKPCIAS